MSPQYSCPIRIFVIQEDVNSPCSSRQLLSAPYPYQIAQLALQAVGPGQAALPRPYFYSSKLQIWIIQALFPEKYARSLQRLIGIMKDENKKYTCSGPGISKGRKIFLANLISGIMVALY